ncbi:MAG: T9SS C-terminal target domain-containing protein, partial [Bacteroidetes bacterium]
SNTYKLTENACVLVEDVYTGNSFSLRDTSLKIVIYDTTTAPRFLIKIGKILSYEKQDVLCYGDSSGMITVDVSNDIANWNTFLINQATGDTLTSSTQWNQLTAGEYKIVHTDDDQLCPSKEETVSILSNDSIHLEISKSDVSCHGMSNGTIVIDTITGGAEAFTVQWSNGTSDTLILSDLPAGNYHVEAIDTNGCSSYRTIVIEEPLPLVMDAISENPVCYGESDGWIQISTTGGTSPYSYIWNNGNTVSALTGLTGGVYQVSVYDVHHCSVTQSISITNPQPLIANFNVAQDTVIIANDHDTITVQLTNTSSDSSKIFNWYMDGTLISQNISPALAFAISDIGIHQIELVMSDSAGCSTNTVKTIYVKADLATNIENFSYDELKIKELQPGYFILTVPQNLRNATAEIYSINGKKIKSFLLQKQTETLDMQNMAKGIYILKTNSDNTYQSYKITVH